MIAVCTIALAVPCSVLAQDGNSGQSVNLRSYVNSQSAMMNPSMMSFMSSDLASLLMQPHIAQELKITEEQTKSIREIMSIRHKAQMESMVEMRKMSEEMRKKFTAGERPDSETIKHMRTVQKEYTAAREKLQADAEDAIFETLERKQSQRLMQLQLQIALKNNGLSSLAQEPLAELLEITPEQKRKLVEKQIEGKKELDEMIEVLRSEMEHQALTEILTKSQLDKLGAMKGDTLEAKRPDNYSQYLRRQVLKEEPTIGGKLLDGARKAVDGIKKELEGDEKKPAR